MIVTIHQPEHLPWLGFFHKADQADVLVLLDSVQYRKNYFQNRNRILGVSGPMWLTVPVLVKGHTTNTIAGMRINNAVAWRSKHWKSILHSYRTHPYFETYSGFIEALYQRDWEWLCALNESVIDLLMSALALKKTVVKASDLPVRGTSTELLLGICRHLGATVYLSGPTGKEYLNEALFTEAGIAVRYHHFIHPVYPQHRTGAFVSHLSTLDLLFNVGPESLNVIRSGSSDQSYAS